MSSAEKYFRERGFGERSSKAAGHQERAWQHFQQYKRYKQSGSRKLAAQSLRMSRQQKRLGRKALLG